MEVVVAIVEILHAVAEGNLTGSAFVLYCDQWEEFFASPAVPIVVDVQFSLSVRY
jgi:hypothetical protein